MKNQEAKKENYSNAFTPVQPALVSINVCCYNAVSRLPDTLKALAHLTLPAGTAAELILVDNASTDGTGSAAKQLWQNLGSPFPIRVVQEPEPGLSYARNCGIRNSSGGIILFCDDDNQPSPDFLERAIPIFLQDSSVAAIGGLGTAIAEVEMPSWFASVQMAYAVGPQTESEGYVPQRKSWLFGACLVVRADYLNYSKLVFSRDTVTGRKGASLMSGEDLEMCYKLVLAGYKLYYTESLKFLHVMAKERLTLPYLQKLMKGAALSSALLTPYKELITPGITRFETKKPSFTFFKRLLAHYLQWNKARKGLSEKFPVSGMMQAGQVFYLDWYVFLHRRQIQNELQDLRALLAKVRPGNV
jgi:glycosyltransferase involved in cell wall biosynthesis